ncbi:MAG: hypothetical protein F7B60_03420 [Desulfurococcales archaeon]|nr:hypothetical protein [Desulfurococcales archaeon]
MAEVRVAGWKGLKEEYKDSLNVKRLDPSIAAERLRMLSSLLKDYSPEAVKEPSAGNPGLLKVEKGGTVIFIAVYSDSLVVLAKDITPIVDEVVDYKEEKSLKALLIVYSRKGRLGPLCYLFLGDVIRDKEVGVLYVNGSVNEVLDVVKSVLSKGEYIVREEDYVDLKEV